MQKAEKALEEFFAETPAHKFVPEMSWTEPVTMAEAEDLASDIDDIRLLEYPDTHILKIVVTPDVVVSLEEIHLDACFHQVHQCRKHADIALRDHIMILIPEIPDVTEQVQRFGLILRNRLEKSHKPRLPVLRIFQVQAEMHIRCKESQ